MNRPLLTNLPKCRVGLLSSKQGCHNLFLVRDNDAKYIESHHRTDNGTHVNERTTPGKDMGVAIAGSNQENKHCDAKPDGAFAKEQFADSVIEQPAAEQAGKRNSDRFPVRQNHHRRINQIG